MVTLLAALLAAAPAPRLAATPFATIDLPAARGELYAEHLATRLLERGLRVTTPRDIATVLGAERQQQLLGCTEGASCITELAGALGVGELLTGQVAKLEDGYQVVVKVLSAETARVRFARTARVDSETELFATLDEWAARIAGQPLPRSWAPLWPIGAGVVAAGVGTAFLVSANQSWSALGRRGADALPYADAVVARDAGQRDQVIGLALVGAGIVAAGAGVTWFALTSPDRQVTALVVPTANGLALVGTLP